MRAFKYIGLALAALLAIAIWGGGAIALLVMVGLAYLLVRTRLIGRLAYSVHWKFLAIVSAMAVLFLYFNLNSFDAMDHMHQQVHVLQEMDRFEPSLVRSALNEMGATPHRRSLSLVVGLSAVIATLGLGVAMAWSVTEPLNKVRQGMLRIASGDFSQPVEVENRDELGELAERINVTAQELARLQQATLDEERTRSLREQVTQVTLAQEEERRRISRELHDGLGPSLAAVGNRLRACRNMVRTDPDRAESELEEVAGDLKGHILQIRELIYELRPMALNQLGLIGALDQYVKRFGDDTGIQASLNVSGDVAVNPLADVTVLRVIQECLANVQAHSEASQVDVTLRDTEEGLEVSVHDNGLGFDPNNAAPSVIGTGVGLMSMRERAELLGGALSVDSHPGGGCRVVVRIPLHEEKVGVHPSPIG